MGKVRILPTASPLDDSLRIVVEYLGERLPAGSPTVEVGLLGLRDTGADTTGWTGQDVYSVRLYRDTLLLGPRRRPGAGSGPCPRCLERRWLVLRPPPERNALERVIPAAPEHKPYVAAPAPVLTAFALDCAWQVIRSVLREPGPGPGETTTTTATAIGHVYELCASSLALARYPLIADPDCTGCGRPRPDTRTAATLTLSSRPKPAVDAYRLRPVGDYDLPVRAYANPVCGVLGPVAHRSYGPAVTAPVTGAFRVRGRFGSQVVTWGGHANTFADSESCALVEGLERYAGLWPRGRAEAVTGSYADLAADALDPATCVGYSDEYYQSHAGRYQPYSPDRPMPWVWGYSLRDHRPVLVPEQLTYYLDRRTGHPNFVQECSSGCATGGSLEEAILHGMLELVERDAFLLTWYTGGTPVEIDVSGCRDREIRFMCDRLNLLGYDARLFDLRTDLPIPVVLAAAVRRDGGPGTLSVGAGASLVPEGAARAALSEAASYVLELPARVEAMLPDLRAMVDDYDRVLDLTAHATLYGLPEMEPHVAFLAGATAPVPIDELYLGWHRDRPATPDLLDDVRYVAGLLTALGTDVVVVDQTCPEQRAAGLHTASLIVPGLVPIDFGWQRQRALRHPRMLAALGGAPPHLHPHPFP